MKCSGNNGIKLRKKLNLDEKSKILVVNIKEKL